MLSVLPLFTSLFSYFLLSLSTICMRALYTAFCGRTCIAVLPTQYFMLCLTNFYCFQVLASFERSLKKYKISVDRTWGNIRIKNPTKHIFQRSSYKYYMKYTKEGVNLWYIRIIVEVVQKTAMARPNRKHTIYMLMERVCVGSSPTIVGAQM